MLRNAATNTAPNANRSKVRKMDDATRQVVKALEHSFELQLKPIEHSIQLQLKPIQERLEDILKEQRSLVSTMRTLEKDSALLDHRVTEVERDLNKGMAAIRNELHNSINDNNRRMAPLFAAIPGIVAILIAVYFGLLTN